MCTSDLLTFESVKVQWNLLLQPVNVMNKLRLSVFETRPFQDFFV